MPRVFARSLALAIAVAIPAPVLAQSPTDVPGTHTVKEGDTLWDLARQYYTDPLQWPRIYQLNTGVVEDPHWIYPGEVLRLSSEDAVASVPTDPGVPAAAEPAPVDAAPVTEARAEDPSSREAAEVVAPVAAEEVASQGDTTPIFPRPGLVMSEPTIRADFNDNFRAVTRAEFYQAGFMTEGKDHPFGELLGTVAPTQVAARGTQAARLYADVAIRPPAPGAYQVGDSVMAVWIDPRGFGGNGNIVVPVGLIRITDVSRPEAIGTVVAQYNSIIPGMKIIPAEKFTERPGVRSQPIADGVEGTIIAFRSKDVLRGLGDIVFVDKGSAAGMAIGDILEARRTIEPRDKMPVVIPEVVVTLQVIHVGEQTSTTRVVWVKYPDVPVDTKWKTVGRLPG